MVRPESAKLSFVGSIPTRTSILLLIAGALWGLEPAAIFDAALQAEQSLKLTALLVAQSRAEALERARELEARAAARAEHDRFFAGATRAHPDARPWR